MGLRDLNVLACGIDPRDVPAQAGERLAKKPSAAADVEHSTPREQAPPGRIEAEMARCLASDPAEAGRVHGVQGSHGAFLVPPGRGKAVETLDLGFIYGRGSHGSLVASSFALGKAKL